VEKELALKITFKLELFTQVAARQLKDKSFQIFVIVTDKCSAVAEMGDRMATTDMGRKLRGGGCAHFGGSWVPI